jgi:hypothetical protein
MCYEKPGSFCHRHLVAEWLRENGFDCREYWQCGLFLLKINLFYLEKTKKN